MFADRRDAGRRLAGELLAWRELDPVVVGVARGGVVLAREVAAVLGVDWEILVVAKVGSPVRPDLAMAAVGEHDVIVLNSEVVRASGVSAGELRARLATARCEVDARASRYRNARARVSLADRAVIVVDDGVVTGATARAACAACRMAGAARVVLAVAILPERLVGLLHADADEVVRVDAPHRLSSIGAYYDEFTPVDDLALDRLLTKAGRQH